LYRCCSKAVTANLDSQSINRGYPIVSCPITAVAIYPVLLYAATERKAGNIVVSCTSSALVNLMMVEI
jgi:hypothetical protein